MQCARSFLLIGNSRWHWAINSKEDFQFIHTSADTTKLQSLQDSLLAWAAVGPIPSGAFLNPKNRLEIKDIPLNKMPPWLGIDRALGAWGALKKSKVSNKTSTGLLVADAGTILSITRITANGEFAGGQLVPGLKLQLLAMTQGAHNLKDPGEIQPSLPSIFPFSTAEAMHRGSVEALVGTLIEGQKQTNLPIWLCGGDSPIIFQELIKRNVNALHHPNLVMEGLIDIHSQLN